MAGNDYPASVGGEPLARPNSVRVDPFMEEK
jgi:hypothetical protein